MKTIIRTATGSIYVLDEVAKTWERTHKTSESGFLRGGGKGTYNELTGLQVGQRLILGMEPFHPGGPLRVIVTSEICFIDRE